MRRVNDTVLVGDDDASIDGNQIDSNQLINISFHCLLSDATGAGTFKVQASNDKCPQGAPNAFVVTNWVDVPNASVALLAGAQKGLITLTNISYRWLRVVYTVGTPGDGTATVNSFAVGV